MRQFSFAFKIFQNVDSLSYLHPLQDVSLYYINHNISFKNQPKWGTVYLNNYDIDRLTVNHRTSRKKTCQFVAHVISTSRLMYSTGFWKSLNKFDEPSTKYCTLMFTDVCFRSIVTILYKALNLSIPHA